MTIVQSILQIAIHKHDAGKDQSGVCVDGSPHHAARCPVGRQTGIRRQNGFTLLEIMVVVALVVLTVSLVGVNLGRDLDQIAQLEARRFARLTEHVRDVSMISGRIYAVEIDQKRKRYQFLLADNEWKPVTRDDVLRPRYFPDYLSIRFEVPQQTVAHRGRVIIQGLDEITPFRLAVAGDEFWHVVSLDDSLNIRVERTRKDDI